MNLRLGTLATISLLLAAGGCSDRAAPEDDEPVETSTAALTQSLRLPFPPGHTWYICQSYVGFSHKSNRPFDIGWTKASCNAANNDSGGRPITAPGAGKITRMPNTVAGGDFMCLSLTGGGSIVLGHVKPETGINLGSTVAAGQKVATVRTSTDPAAQNAGIAHLHYEAFSGDSCYVGTAQAFTGAWRMQCAPSLPYVATANYYNGTPITACAPDAGATPTAPKDAGLDAATDAAAPVEEDASTSEPTTTTADATEPDPPSRRSDDGAADDGCTVARSSVGATRATGASTLALLAAIAFLVIAGGSRRRGNARGRGGSDCGGSH
jgi:hypothetical protein